MSETIIKEKIEEIIIQTDLKTFLSDIADSRFGYRIGKPWKYSEESLGVVVPILKDNPPDRQYVTMYEVLKDLNMKDTGSISHVEIQNKTGMAIFVRAGTIFTGKTQNRAAQHSGVYEKEKERINVRCVEASHGINMGEKMEFGDIAPPSITIDLMRGSQGDVWNSVTRFTSGHTDSGEIPSSWRSYGASHVSVLTLDNDSGRNHFMAQRTAKRGTRPRLFAASHIDTTGFKSDDLLGHLNKIKEGQSALDDMMQKVPLFPDQVGAVLFNPNGVIALETFDSPKSWEAIKKEIVEKYGDKIKEKQAEHLFELKPEMILPMLRKFIGELDNFKETTIRKDAFSETREVIGKGVVGEYTLVKGQPIHVLLLKEDNT